MFCVIGLGNEYEDDADGTGDEHRRLLKASGGAASSQQGTGLDGSNSENEGEESDFFPAYLKGTEYQFTGLHWGTIISTFRISIGDFSAIDTSASLAGANNWMFWIIFLFIMMATCVVFLNFIVAEASASYAKVTETLEEIIYKEMAALISEADGM